MWGGLGNKQGATTLFNDLYKRMVGRSVRLRGTVISKPDAAV
jgi:hypothetical protein